DRPRAAPGEPRREVRGAAAKLDDVQPVDVTDDAELRLGHLPYAPADLFRRPRGGRPSVGVLGVRLRPDLAVSQGRVGEAHGNQSAISRSADSGESDPCTRLSGIESARSPRMVPGAESFGFVAPIVVRTTGIADSPSSTSASV